MIVIDGEEYNEFELSPEHPIWKFLTDKERQEVRKVQRKVRGKEEVEVRCVKCHRPYYVQERALKAKNGPFHKVRLCMRCRNIHKNRIYMP